MSCCDTNTPDPPTPTPTQPPVQSCTVLTITSQTVATSPTNRARTRIGVGEEVTLTANPGPATWAITSGTGRLSPSSGSHTSVTFTADDNAGSVTITATGSGCSGTITFTVVQPSSWTMEKAPGTNLKHANGRPDCGWKGLTWYHPDDVNFYNVQVREQDSQAVTTGSYNTFSGVKHGNYAGGFSAWFPVVRHDPAKGSTDDAPDEIYSGDPGAANTRAAPPFTTGTMYFPIVLQWRVGSGSPHNFPSVRQEHEIFAPGRCESRKGAHTESRMYNDPTSTY
jgi:type VI secretion system secreted protein VgrG